MSYYYFSHKVTKAEKLYKLIANKIDNDEYLPGERLPSERNLAASFQVSRKTIQATMSLLEENHYVSRIQGAGTFVRQKKERTHMPRNPYSTNPGNYFRMIGENSHDLHVKVFCVGSFCGRHFFADKLDLDLDEEIFGIHKVRYDGEKPIGVEYTYYPVKFFPDIASYNFTHVDELDYMELKGHVTVRFEETVLFTEAGIRMEKFLEIPPEEIITYQELVGYDRDNNIIVYSECFYRNDCLEMEFAVKLN